MAVWNLKRIEDESNWLRGAVEVKSMDGKPIGIMETDAFEGAIDPTAYDRLLSGEAVLADFVGTVQPDPEPCPDDPEYDAFLKRVLARQRDKRRAE